MDQIGKGVQNNHSRRLLMETLAGHMALLQASHPRKAKSAVTKKARQCVLMTLRQTRSKAA
ncbi:MAG TPA: hypothetical protein VF669_06515 [Tepidisphaeraceae bacterium]|jgi:hypothetical protein